MMKQTTEQSGQIILFMGKVLSIEILMMEDHLLGKFLEFLVLEVTYFLSELTIPIRRDSTPGLPALNLMSEQYIFFFIFSSKLYR